MKIKVGDKYKDAMTGQIAIIVEIKGNAIHLMEYETKYSYWVHSKWLSSRFVIWTKLENKKAA